MSIFVNELSPPHARSHQGQCVRQCRRIMKDTLRWLSITTWSKLIIWRELPRIMLPKLHASGAPRRAAR